MILLRGYGVLIYKGSLCVPNVDGIRNLILEEAHRTRYSIYPGLAKMYHDLSEVYWWECFKKDIMEFVPICTNFQQLKGKIKSWMVYFMKSKFLLGCGKT